MVNDIKAPERPLVLFLISLLLISLQAGTVWAQDLPGLFIAADNEMTVRKIPGLIPDRINVKVDFSPIKPSGAPRASVQAALPDRDVELLRDRTETSGEGNYTWVGRVEGHELSTAVITVVNGIAVGHIDMDGESYALLPKNGGYQIVKEDTALAAPFYDDARIPVIPHQAGRRYLSAYPDYLPAEDGSRIDVLVLYTQQMVNTYGAGLAAKIQNFVDLANTAYTNSGINTQIRMVNSALFTDADAAEGVAVSNALNHLTGSSNAKALRETYKADLVSLLRVYPGTEGTSCGWAWIMNTVDNTFADMAFSVVEVKDSESGGFYCPSNTLAHELGHNNCAKTINNTRTTVANFRMASVQSGVNNCAASVSSSLVVHIPIVTYSGSNYWLDLQYNSSNSTLTLAPGGAGTVSNVSTYGSCTASTLSSDFKLHIPVVMISGVSYWLDLQYNGSAFAVTGYGQN